MIPFFILSLSLFFPSAWSYLNYITQSGLTCHETSQVGITQSCCDESNPTWGQFCNGDLPGPEGCLPNEILSGGLESSSGPITTGPICYSPGQCSANTWQYNYKCCPCPSGYQVYSVVGPYPNCDSGAMCVGCTDPKEHLVGNSTAGWSCTTAAQPACPSGTKSNACTASGTSCDFYTCIEGNHNCGSSGYPLGYGLKYCKDFAAFSPQLSTAGQAWVKATTLCLQKSLAADVQCKATCDNIKDDAYASHASCYVGSGLCSLPVSDWKKIVSVVSFEDLFLSKAALEQSLKAAAGCASLYAQVFAGSF